MKNRIASLFALDTLLGTNGNGHGAAAHPPVPRRKRKGHTTGPGHPAKRAAPQVAARSFDKGDPIHCEHDVAYKPVAVVDVGEPPATPATPVAHQLGDEYDVEAFEEPDDDLAPRLSEEEEEEADQQLGTASSAAPEEGPEYHPPPEEVAEPAVVQSASYRKPATFAAEMTAVERDLADLASRVAPPAPATVATPEESADAVPEPAADPTATPAQKASGHAVFDQMAQGMGYATEFRLPPVQLSQVFSALDRQLDAEARTTTPAAPAVGPATPDPAAIVPSSETLIKDLVALPEAQPDTESTPVTQPA